MISRRQLLQSLAVSAAAGALTPSPLFAQAGQRLASAANRAQVIDLDFDVSPYLTQLKSAGVTTIGRYYDRGYGRGVGESCYHHPLKTLTKAELTAIENAGMSVYVVFQHCGAQCVNFDLQNKETAEKGRKDAAGAIELAQKLGQPPDTPIYFAIDYDPYPGSDCALPAARIWPSIDAYFDQVNEVMSDTRWQVGVYGAGITCQRLKDSGKAKYFWMSSSLGHVGSPRFFNSGQWHLFQNVIEIKRSFARNTIDTDVANPSQPYFGQWTSHGPAAPHHPDTMADILASRAFVKKRLHDCDRSRQRQVSPGSEAARALQFDVPHPHGRGQRLLRREPDRGRCRGRLCPQVRSGFRGIGRKSAGRRRSESPLLPAADGGRAQAGHSRLGKSNTARQ